MNIKKLVYGYTTDDGGFDAVTVTVKFDPTMSNDVFKQQLDTIISSEERLSGRRNIRLLADIGVPDIHIVLENGEVAAVFVRNCKDDPQVVVTDMDFMLNDPLDKHERMLAGNQINDSMQRGGFRFIPHGKE